MKTLTLKTSDRIEYDKNLGVHKTYKGFKWQPGSGLVCFIRPGKRAFEFIKGDFTKFKWLVDRNQI